MKYGLHRKAHISRSPALAVADGDNVHHSTTSKKREEVTTESSTEEVPKGTKVPDAIFKAVLLSRVRERAALAVPDTDHTAACCKSIASTENNSSLDPEHQLPPPQPQMDQPVAASAVTTQGKNATHKASSYSPVDSHSTSESDEQAELSPIEDPTSSSGSGGTGSSPNNVSHNDF